MIIYNRYSINEGYAAFSEDKIMLDGTYAERAFSSSKAGAMGSGCREHTSSGAACADYK